MASAQGFLCVTLARSAHFVNSKSPFVPRTMAAPRPMEKSASLPGPCWAILVAGPGYVLEGQFDVLENVADSNVVETAEMSSTSKHKFTATKIN